MNFLKRKLLILFIASKIIPCLPSKSYLYAYCMRIMENLAVVTFYDLQELLNVSTCATSVNVRDFNAKTMCLGAYSILVLSFFFNTIEKHFYSSKIRRAKNVSSLEEY